MVKTEMEKTAKLQARKVKGQWCQWLIDDPTRLTAILCFKIEGQHEHKSTSRVLQGQGPVCFSHAQLSPRTGSSLAVGILVPEHSFHRGAMLKARAHAYSQSLHLTSEAANALSSWCSFTLTWQYVSVVVARSALRTQGCRFCRIQCLQTHLSLGNKKPVLVGTRCRWKKLCYRPPSG